MGEQPEKQWTGAPVAARPLGTPGGAWSGASLSASRTWLNILPGEEVKSQASSVTSPCSRSCSIIDPLRDPYRLFAALATPDIINFDGISDAMGLFPLLTPLQCL